MIKQLFQMGVFYISAGAAASFSSTTSAAAVTIANKCVCLLTPSQWY